MAMGIVTVSVHHNHPNLYPYIVVSPFPPSLWKYAAWWASAVVFYWCSLVSVEVATFQM